MTGAGSQSNTDITVEMEEFVINVSCYSLIKVVVFYTHFLYDSLVRVWFLPLKLF